MNRTKYVRRICDRIRKRLAVSYRLLFLARFWGTGRASGMHIRREIQRDTRELLSVLSPIDQWKAELYVTVAIVEGAQWAIAEVGRNPLPDWFVDKECEKDILGSAFGRYRLFGGKETPPSPTDTGRQLTLAFEAEGR